MALLNHPSRRCRQRGSLTIEMALCFPLLLILFIGGIELSLMAYNQQILTSAAREGAREAAMYRSTATIGNVLNNMNARWGGMLVSMSGEPGANPILLGPGSQDCISSGGTWAQVNARFVYTFITPFADTLLKPVTLSAGSRMNCE